MNYKDISLYIYIMIMSVFGCKAQYTDVKPDSVEASVNIDNVVSNQGSYPADTSLWSIDYIMGRFDPATHPDFIVIPAIYRDSEIRYLRKDVMRSFTAMYEAALKDGIRLRILSATRNFDNQKRIWENKWTGKTILDGNINAARQIVDPELRARKILEYSSMPGTSRHHWGTDIDLNDFNNSFFERGDGKKIYEWLTAHAHEYGFCQPYTAFGDGRNTGYFEEKWHWSYLPIALPLTQAAKKKMKNEMITGFHGAETATKIDMLQNYILGINTACNPE